MIFIFLQLHNKNWNLNVHDLYKVNIQSQQIEISMYMASTKWIFKANREISMYMSSTKLISLSKILAKKHAKNFSSCFQVTYNKQFKNLQWPVEDFETVLAWSCNICKIMNDLACSNGQVTYMFLASSKKGSCNFSCVKLVWTFIILMHVHAKSCMIIHILGIKVLFNIFLIAAIISLDLEGASQSYSEWMQFMGPLPKWLWPRTGFSSDSFAWMW